MPDSIPTKAKRRDTRGAKRRRLIFKSLHDCILAKGYVKTTLADIAAGADMSASHLLYYFKGKEAILERYFESVSESYLDTINEFSDQNPREQIQSITDFWFNSKSTNIKEIGFMLECFGAAVNDAVLRKTKQEFDKQCKTYLANVFDDCPGILVGGSNDAAEVAYSLMIGLRTAVYFDNKIGLDDAHRLFLNSILTISGLDPEA